MKRWRNYDAPFGKSKIRSVARERIPVDDTGEIISTGIGYAPE